MYKCIFCNKLTNDSERDHWCKEKKKAYADVESTVDPVEKPSHNPPQSNESAQVEKAGESSGQVEKQPTADESPSLRESERKTLQQWRERNRERYNETMRQWREDNREKVRAYQREYMRQRRNK